jgi:serine/threonine-protein kinase
VDTTVADALIGTLIDGRYLIRSRVAKGGMATVYTAVDQRLERTVALKIIHPAQARDARFLDRFTDEAKTIARLTHPNVVAVYDQGTHDGLPYLIMEYVRGRTLRELLTDRRRLAPAETLAIMEQMLAAVAAAHRAGLVHRDIKPENVLVAEAPGGGSLVDAVVKVADFGLARAVEASADDANSHLLATVAYVAPELVTDGHADPRTDVYSAGIVLFEMLTGRVPYDGDKPVEVAWRHVDQDVPPPSRYVAGLPPILDGLVARATRRNPSGRPTDAGAMLAEVGAAREEIGTTVRMAAGPTVSMTPVSAPTQAIPATGRPGGWNPSGRPAESVYQGGGYRPTRHPNALVSRYRSLTSTARGRQAFAALIVVFGLLVAVGGWWFGVGRYTQAPALTALSKDQAVSQAHKLGFQVRFGSQYDEKIPKDTVLSQSPGAGKKVVKGGTVTLVLSLGPERYSIPNENGEPYDQAVAQLTALKLVPKRVETYDDTMPTGNVLSTDPPAGTVVPPHTEVAVKVSIGKAPITVPDVVGEDANTAQAQLKALGLSVAFQQQQSDRPANTVLTQSIADGSGAVKGQTIILTISSGPPLVTVPNLVNQGYSFDQANQILQQLGLTAQKMFEIPGGQVRQQNPSPGAQVPKGTQVQVWIY